MMSLCLQRLGACCRPVILPDYAEVELRVPEDARCGAWVCFDGKRRQELLRGDAVAVRMSTNPLPTVSNNDQTRYLGLTSGV